MSLVIQLQLGCHNTHMEVMDKTARGFRVIFAIGSIKHVMINIDKLHDQVTVLTLNKLGSNTNCEINIALIKHGVEILTADASIS